MEGGTRTIMKTRQERKGKRNMFSQRDRQEGSTKGREEGSAYKKVCQESETQKGEGRRHAAKKMMAGEESSCESK